MLLRKMKGKNVMGLPNKNEVKGKLKAAKGAVEARVGRAIGDNKMERKGAADRAAGNVRAFAGKVERKVGEAIEDVGKFVRK
jgi:uncharacterized protein YjbJ (UPF0337 family)